MDIFISQLLRNSFLWLTSRFTKWNRKWIAHHWRTSDLLWSENSKNRLHRFSPLHKQRSIQFFHENEYCICENERAKIRHGLCTRIILYNKRLLLFWFKIMSSEIINMNIPNYSCSYLSTSIFIINMNIIHENNYEDN